MSAGKYTNIVKSNNDNDEYPFTVYELFIREEDGKAFVRELNRFVSLADAYDEFEESLTVCIPLKWVPPALLEDV